MHFVYIIYSEKLDRFYIGETEDFQRRLITFVARFQQVAEIQFNILLFNKNPIFTTVTRYKRATVVTYFITETSVLIL